MFWRFLFIFPLIAIVGCRHKTEISIMKPPSGEESMNKLSADLAKKYGLEVVHVGSGHLIDDDEHAAWAIHFASRQKLERGQVACIADPLAKEIVAALHWDPMFKKTADYGREHIYGMRDYCFNDDSIGFKITFWDENFDRPLYPYVAQVRFAQQKMHYYYADPQTQALVEACEESTY